METTQKFKSEASTSNSKSEENSINPKISADKAEEVIRKEPFWVFGYGSLCWNPGFEYQQSITGYVKGFSRRFWQGNTTHRGTDTHPGRVATLIEDNEGITWGKAFLVAADNGAALPYLTTRECQLGGYRTYTVNFHPRTSQFLPGNSNNKKDAILYIAIPENRHWLGAAPLPEIAKQILECRGSAGSNVEYLLRLADFMREEVPEALDEHLFSLERLVRKFAADMKIGLQTLMGEPRERQEEKEAKAVVPSSYYASRIPDKKLRCVNM
ncbi:putative glutathione-specific gamma-glutamylcyclotransferase 2 [Colias croceus]|uniref:putative glutathione-specific gamma-glutamylcyclotransferase 2 n=1 Tax=Colias crocea TaxID=72248 RepID=UPI001E27B018|nr:putative glutathione-specific gamma-glutamylcyclotransferase 2 [Colias croceus]